MAFKTLNELSEELLEKGVLTDEMIEFFREIDGMNSIGMIAWLTSNCSEAIKNIKNGNTVTYKGEKLSADGFLQILKDNLSDLIINKIELEVETEEVHEKDNIMDEMEESDGECFENNANPYKKHGNAINIILAIMLCIAISVIFCLIIGLEKQENKLEDTVEEKIQYASVSPTYVYHNTWSDIVEKVLPSIVTITIDTTEKPAYGTYDIFSGAFVGKGSGVIINNTGEEMLILTNQHVIDKSKSITVSFFNGDNASANVKAADTHTDIAVVSIPISDINENTLEEIKPATLGDSSKMKMGDDIIAIGNSNGDGITVTSGMISTIRLRTAEDNGSKLPCLQTDAAVNPGDSGGALVNINGEVIGILQSKVVDSSIEGIGLAIPITDNIDKINKLCSMETRKKVDSNDRGYLNITCIGVTDAVSQAYGIPLGISVSFVYEGGAADKAGIMPRDVITELDGYCVYTPEELLNRLEYYKTGEKVTIKIMRPDAQDYKELEVEVTLMQKN